MGSHITILLLVANAASSGCFADEVYKYYRNAAGARAFDRVDGGELQPQDAFHAYDNWRTPSFGGNTNEFRGIYRCGTAEMADDLNLVTQGPALISDIGFSITNMSLTSRVNQYRVTHRFYDLQRTLIGSDSFTITDAPIQAGSGVAFYSDGGFYTPFGIVVPTHVFMSIQISDVVGADPADIGAFLCGPRTTGYSSQYFYNLTNGDTINFDGSDQTNMQFFINTVSLPAPSVAAILAGAIPVAVRRRR